MLKIKNLVDLNILLVGKLSFVFFSWIVSGILVGGGFLVSGEFVWQLPAVLGGESAPTGDSVVDLGSTTY